MDQSVWGPGEYVAVLSIALGGMYLLSRLAAWLGWVSTDTEEPASEQPAVMSNDEQVLLSTILFLWWVDARSETKRAQAERNEAQNERDISANRRDAIKKWLDTERRNLPPDQWTNKTQFRAIVGGNTAKAGELFDELQRELDTVELEGLNAALATR